MWGWFIHCHMFFSVICFSLEVAVLTIHRLLGFFLWFLPLSLFRTLFTKLGKSALIQDRVDILGKCLLIIVLLEILPKLECSFVFN